MVDKTYLPGSYNEDVMTLMVQGPDTVFVYWELSDSHWATVNKKGKAVLRLYRFSGRDAAAGQQSPVEEIQLPPFNTNWYFSGVGSDQDYYCEVGFLRNDGEFLPVLRSNPVHTPALPVTRFELAAKTKITANAFQKSFSKRQQPSLKKEAFVMTVKEVLSTMPFYAGISI
ncbi:hypothetical protein DCCM_3592 [Desulfocucumis palustris]|uniref:DUF4912 domain-containing protein n=1 Tax=Desulfocucumis palustris TaxID=1898651 RepID=A0A2L2XEN8_9FIRM|nr:DUF4912 domain-containing protein [Desulfocucumis palustris]GBF34474.1 hypothetical protein DCCM_3592 [Desulfocucumis palustris]